MSDKEAQPSLELPTQNVPTAPPAQQDLSSRLDALLAEADAATEGFENITQQAVAITREVDCQVLGTAVANAQNSVEQREESVTLTTVKKDDSSNLAAKLDALLHSQSEQESQVIASAEAQPANIPHAIHASVPSQQSSADDKAAKLAASLDALLSQRVEEQNITSENFEHNNEIEDNVNAGIDIEHHSRLSDSHRENANTTLQSSSTSSEEIVTIDTIHSSSEFTTDAGDLSQEHTQRSDKQADCELLSSIINEPQITSPTVSPAEMSPARREREIESLDAQLAAISEDLVRDDALPVEAPAVLPTPVETHVPTTSAHHTESTLSSVSAAYQSAGTVTHNTTQQASTPDQGASNTAQLNIPAKSDVTLHQTTTAVASSNNAAPSSSETTTSSVPKAIPSVTPQTSPTESTSNVVLAEEPKNSSPGLASKVFGSLPSPARLSNVLLTLLTPFGKPLAKASPLVLSLSAAASIYTCALGGYAVYYAAFIRPSKFILQAPKGFDIAHGHLAAAEKHKEDHGDEHGTADSHGAADAHGADKGHGTDDKKAVKKKAPTTKKLPPKKDAKAKKDEKKADAGHGGH